jgi:uncharacterized protein YjiS (DUF1127 family)
MTARLVYQSPPPPPVWRRLVNAIVIVIESFVEAYRMRKGIVALQQLDDRMLADIGVTRSGIEAAVRHGERKAAPAPRPAEAVQPLAKAA